MDVEVISSNGGYHVYAGLRPVPHTDGSMQLVFLTSYDQAQDPDALENKFEMVLTPEERARLKALL